MKADFITSSCIGSRGEFGNQLFQIAAVLGYAHEHGREAIFKEWVCTHSSRNYSVYFPSLNYRPSIHPKNTYREIRFGYDEIPGKPALDIIGSFQSERYFFSIREEIKKLFQAPSFIDAEVLAYLAAHGISDYSALHMRYNDRDGIDNNSVMHNLPEHFFVEAARHLVKGRKVLLISNSPTRAKLFGKKHLKDFDYLVSTNRNSLVDFYLLTRAQTVIISNSTFGWWGGYLNPNVEKVYGPLRRRWFGFPTRLEHRWSTHDLYPANFVEIPF